MFLKKFILPGIIIILGIFFYTAYYNQLKKEQNLVFIQVKAVETTTGWGYEISTNGKPYIRQLIIPAVTGQKSFSTKEDALLVGNKVVEKMKMGEQLPMVTIEELKQMGVLKDSIK